MTIKVGLFIVVVLILIAGAVLLVAAPTKFTIGQIFPSPAPGTVAAVAVSLPNGSTAWLPLSGTVFQNTANTLGIIFPTTQVPNFADSETPGGVVDGTNATFTLAHTPTPALSLQLYRNGQLMKAGAGNDYTLAAGTVTFLAGGIPQAGDVLTASYRF